MIWSPSAQTVADSVAPEFAGGIVIDVEVNRVIRDADGIAARSFSRRKNAAYLDFDQHDRAQGFFSCRTREEAPVNALGEDLHFPLECFAVSVAPGEPARILRVENTPGEHYGRRVESLSPAAGLCGSVRQG